MYRNCANVVCIRIRREGVGENEGEASNHWKKIRVDRMLVEHFLRSGFYNSAIRLSEAAKIEDLTNISLFLVAKEVEEALARKDTSKCLAWCHDNKSKMRKMKSTLEFNVRLQEYIELVKAGNKLEAVRHARKHLCGPGEDPGHLAMVQQAMALLAFQPDTAVTPYADLFREERWQQLIEQFRKEQGITPREITDQEILERCVYVMINEGAKILEEGIADRPLDIDIVWIYGYGFPAYRGGPMFWADQEGLDTILSAVKKYQDTVGGEQWEPAALLEKLVAEGRKFADL